MKNAHDIDDTNYIYCAIRQNHLQAETKEIVKRMIKNSTTSIINSNIISEWINQQNKTFEKKIILNNLSVIYEELQSESKLELSTLKRIFPEEVIQYTALRAYKTAKKALEKIHEDLVNNDKKVAINKENIDKIIAQCLDQVNQCQLYNKKLTKDDLIMLINKKNISQALQLLFAKSLLANDSNTNHIKIRSDFKSLLGFSAWYRQLCILKTKLKKQAKNGHSVQPRHNNRRFNMKNAHDIDDTNYIYCAIRQNHLQAETKEIVKRMIKNSTTSIINSNIISEWINQQNKTFEKKIILNNLSVIYEELQSESKLELSTLKRIFPEEVIQYTALRAYKTAKKALEKIHEDLVNNDNKVTINKENIDKIIAQCLDQVNQCQLYNKKLTKDDLIMLINKKNISQALQLLFAKSLLANDSNTNHIKIRSDFKSLLGLSAGYRQLCILKTKLKKQVKNGHSVQPRHNNKKQNQLRLRFI